MNLLPVDMNLGDDRESPPVNIDPGMTKYILELIISLLYSCNISLTSCAFVIPITISDKHKNDGWMSAIQRKYIEHKNIYNAYILIYVSLNILYYVA